MPMFIDASPSENGRYLVDVAADLVVHAGFAAPGTARAARVIGRHTYTDHADTCPFASAWNKKPGGRRNAGRSRGRAPARAATRRR